MSSPAPPRQSQDAVLKNCSWQALLDGTRWPQLGAPNIAVCLPVTISCGNSGLQTSAVAAEGQGSADLRPSLLREGAAKRATPHGVKPGEVVGAGGLQTARRTASPSARIMKSRQPLLRSPVLPETSCTSL